MNTTQLIRNFIEQEIQNKKTRVKKQLANLIYSILYENLRINNTIEKRINKLIFKTDKYCYLSLNDQIIAKEIEKKEIDIDNNIITVNDFNKNEIYENKENLISYLGGYLLQKKFNDFSLLIIEDNAIYELLEDKEMINVTSNHKKEGINLITTIMPSEKEEIRKIIKYKNLKLIPLSAKEKFKQENILILNKKILLNKEDIEIKNLLKEIIDEQIKKKHKTNIVSIKELEELTQETKPCGQKHGNTFLQINESFSKRITEKIERNIKILNREEKVKKLKKLKEKTKKEIIENGSNNKIFKKNTFKRLPRRENKLDQKGIIKKKKIIPEIDIYLDTSQSISTREYQQGITTVIEIAKAINSKYINIATFSDKVTEMKKIKTSNKNKEKIKKEINNIPKITGGTNFKDVWTKINNDKSKNIIFIISDFDYIPERNIIIDKNKKIYYIPIEVNNQNSLLSLKNSIYKFIIGMKSIGYDLEKRFLF